ncbi:MAG: polyphosphate--glucose phosphotransferase [Micrococcales bacterium]
MAKIAIGIDIGGTGIKAALVDVKNGEMMGDRVRVETPDGGSTDDIIKTVKALIKKLPSAPDDTPIGICFPAVVQHGVTKSAANISKKWIGFDADRAFTKALGRDVHLVNDADAAGLAEMRFGAGRAERGVVIMTTLGTGIGSAIFYDQKLIPNAELGHLQIDGVDYETKAAFSAKEREGLSWDEWAKRLQKYYSTLQRLFSPDLIIVGGGVSKEHEKFLPLLDIDCEIVPAEMRNNAGILGAARLAYRLAHKE